jgi:hypothetical protein
VGERIGFAAEVLDLEFVGFDGVFELGDQEAEFVNANIHVVDVIGKLLDFAFEFEGLVMQGLEIFAAFCFGELLEGAESAEAQGEEDQEVGQETGLHGGDVVRVGWSLSASGGVVKGV